MKAHTALALLAVSSACSVGSFDGKVAGLSFTPKDAVYAAANFPADANNTVPLTIGLIVLTSTGNACQDLTDHIQRESQESLVLSLLSVGSTAQNPPKATYNTDPNSLYTALTTGTSSNAALALFRAVDTNCAGVSALSADAGTSTSGNVVLNSADGSSANGTFTLKFGTDKASGTFSASSCTALKDTINNLANGFGYNVSAVSDPNFSCKP